MDGDVLRCLPNCAHRFQIGDIVRIEEDEPGSKWKTRLTGCLVKVSVEEGGDDATAQKEYRLILKDGSTRRGVKGKQLLELDGDMKTEWRNGDVIGAAIDVDERRAEFFHMRRCTRFEENRRNVNSVADLFSPNSSPRVT